LAWLMWDADVANEAASEMVGRGLQAISIAADVANVAQVEAAVAAVTKEFGLSPNVLVNNAGVVRARHDPQDDDGAVERSLDHSLHRSLQLSSGCPRWHEKPGLWPHDHDGFICWSCRHDRTDQLRHCKGWAGGFHVLGSKKNWPVTNILANAIAPVANTRMTETLRK